MVESLVFNLAVTWPIESVVV